MREITVARPSATWQPSGRTILPRVRRLFGTLICLSDEVVRVYRAESPEQPAIYRRGETAEAEPAVPGWKFAVDELFD